MKRPLRILLFLVVLPALVAAYARWIEPAWLAVETYTIEGGVTRPLRIAFVGDLHAPDFDGIAKEAAAAIVAAKPDLVLLGGDLVHAHGEREPVEQFISALPAAPLGIYLVTGNWEYWALGTSVERFYRPDPGHWLVNTATTVRDDVHIVGLDDFTGGQPDPRVVDTTAEAPGFTVGLLHSPGGIGPLVGKVDLVLAAHTHGGQVRVPFYGALVTPPGSGDYDAGWYERGPTRVFVTRGVGTSIYDVRLFCRPEVAIIDVVPRR